VIGKGGRAADILKAREADGFMQPDSRAVIADGHLSYYIYADREKNRVSKIRLLTLENAYPRT
jgi:hypothetical protein